MIKLKKKYYYITLEIINTMIVTNNLIKSKSVSNLTTNRLGPVI